MPPIKARQTTLNNLNSYVIERQSAKPFVKWAGGKGQLLPYIRNAYPAGLGTTITRYAEPFVGGGAVLFDILSNFDLKEVYISDINAELINAYITIRDSCASLINFLSELEMAYLPQTNDTRKNIFYAKRDRYNFIKANNLDDPIEMAALFIFLNKTCFNGLYRVNRNGLFNVPIGSYKRPKICDKTNLKNISKLLQNVKIVCGNYQESVEFVDENTFVYFDPPYRPLTTTANFTSYTEAEFDDEAQIRLAEYVKLLDSKHAKVLVSNSDPKNNDKNDNFFDDLYAGLEIKRVSATRMINCNSDARGKISELLVSNYPVVENE